MRSMEKDCIASSNACRAVGIRLQALCGHEQISFEYWQKNNCSKQLPFDFNAAKMFIGIARKLPEKVTTIEQAAPFTQLCFQAGNLLELPERTEQQRAIGGGILQKFFGEITIVRKDFAKAIRQCPMEKWGRPEINSFLKDTQWLADERTKAEKLKGEK